MANIEQKLQYALQCKEDIKAALLEKGIIDENCVFAEYADRIRNAQSGGGLIIEQNAPKVYTKSQLIGVYDNFCIIGALLSNDGNNWTIWNTNPVEPNYWDPTSDTITTPSTQYGEVIAVCVGRGLWAKIGWSGLTTGMQWARSGSELYYSYCGATVHNNGWFNTNHIINNHDGYVSGGYCDGGYCDGGYCDGGYCDGGYCDGGYTSNVLWNNVKSFNDNSEDYKIFIPSKLELIEIHNNTCDGTHVDEQVRGTSAHTFNKNLGKLLSLSTVGYWSSSQYASQSAYYYYAFGVYFDNGYVGYDYKTSSYRSIALLHF